MMNPCKAIFRRVSAIIQNDNEPTVLYAVLVHPKLVFLRLKVPFEPTRLRSFDKRLIHELPRRRVVQLHVQRRNRQSLSNIVKTARRRVIRKAVRRLEIHTQQIPDSVVVLSTVHPAQNHPVRTLRGLGGGKVGLKPIRELICLGRARLEITRRGHLMPTNHIEDFPPLSSRCRIRECRRQCIQTEIPKRRNRAMTFNAVLVKQRPDP